MVVLHLQGVGWDRSHPLLYLGHTHLSVSQFPGCLDRNRLRKHGQEIYLLRVLWAWTGRQGGDALPLVILARGAGDTMLD